MNASHFALAACLLVALVPPGHAQNDSEKTPSPLLIWRFDGKAEPGVPKGGKVEPGPRPPAYPGFAASNNSWRFNGPKSIITVREKDVPDHNLRFTLGDTITLEAWVNVAELKPGSYAYLVGKGRNRKTGFPEKNQNYALRLLGSKDGAKVSFLFASAPEKGKPADWHRWTTKQSFSLAGWHHVAVIYTFGKPKSIRGSIDGKVVTGTWDMGGATERGPVADADDLVFGTGNGGGAGNTFRGSLDEVAIWREALPEATLAARYQFVPPPPPIQRASLPKGQVLVQLCEQGMPTSNSWPTTALQATQTYREEAFGFFEVPHKYVGSKVRGGLRLDERKGALKAIVPGKPEKSELLARLRSTEPSEVMPPKGDPLTKEQIATLETWIKEGARWPDIQSSRTTLTPLTDDLSFLRRVTLDTVGVVPSAAEIDTFLKDPPGERRKKAIDRLLADPRWADHWMGYWQDVLAENPNIINPTLNNTGPFRWWLYESFRDNKPMDLFVTELVRMGGSNRFGGPAGFAVASQNDAPMASKGMILAGTFLGVQMKCARCHDAPAHRSTQQDLFQLAAMLDTKAQKLPASSTVPLDRLHLGARKPLIRVSLKPGSVIEPRWPFADFVSEKEAKTLAEHPDSPRDRLAALITAPGNERFAQVIVNRVWRRYMGRGLVEPVDDWEKGKPSHPELLRWLGREFVRGGYDLKHIARLILNSHAYQRATDRSLRDADPLFAAPSPRRLDAEQIVDSLFAATGKPFRLEEVSLDIDGQRNQSNSITLGKPRRAWMLTSTSNERDRPSLALPRITAVTDVLQAFGWRGARQEPTSYRELDPNVLQPAILSNGTMGGWLTRLSDDHGITKLALVDQSLDKFLDALFLRMLTRVPTAEERKTYTTYLSDGYEKRVRPAAKTVKKRMPEPYVSWSNHLDPEATIVRQQQEAAARRGDPATTRLEAKWRSRLEDVLWAMVNSSEFVFTP